MLRSEFSPFRAIFLFLLSSFLFLRLAFLRAFLLFFPLSLSFCFPPSRPSLRPLSAWVNRILCHRFREYHALDIEFALGIQEVLLTARSG